jgi:tripartite-type tricarboxylate transporter receptor subunit TctC
LNAWRNTLLALVLAGPAVSMAQDAGFPARPITLLVGFAPGGGTDQIARILAPKVGELLKQTLVVDNKAGGSGAIAATTVARANPDGYTLLMGHVSSNAMVPAVKAKVPYAADKDFTPLTVVGSVPQVMTIPTALPVSNVQEFIALAKSRKGKLNYASSGVGTQQHFAAELFQLATGTEMTHVPYKGSGAAVVDLIAGQVDVNFDTLPSVLQHIKSGKLRALAVTTRQRVADLPEVPTLIEAGLKDFEIGAWYMVMGPANLPKPISTKLAAAFIQAANSPDVRAKLLALNTDVVASSPEQARAFLDHEIARWAKVARDKKISEE